jgi:death-on-curing protein
LPTSRRRHYHITLADALSAHDRALRIGGGREGIPNLALVESAIARPYSGYYRPIARKAAALVQSVATNHGFADGNKRTATILLQQLLHGSGYRLMFLPDDGDPDDAMADMVLAVVNRRLSFDEIVEWLRARVRPSGPA